jgi:hypothetical protein
MGCLIEVESLPCNGNLQRKAKTTDYKYSIAESPNHQKVY